MAYWASSFTGKTWQEFQQSKAAAMGFRQHHYKRSQRMRKGDRILCYMVGVKRWVGLLEVTGSAYQDDKKIWSEELFPVRLPVQPVVMLTATTGLPMEQLRGRLTFFGKETQPRQWSGHLRQSPMQYKEEDGRIIAQAICQTHANPIEREVDPRKLNRLAKRKSTTSLYKTKINTGEGEREAVLGVPENEEDEQLQVPSITAESTGSVRSNETLHTQIQYRLLELGSKMGLQVWAPRNDRGRSWNGQPIAHIDGLLPTLPTSFDSLTNRIVENIDVLWMSPQNAIVAAFEVEHSTAIYSGLLRMSDLLTMQPNIDIKLYIVAPGDRFEKFKRELPRPTFACRKRPLHRMCGFVPYARLQETLNRHHNMLDCLKPEFLDKITQFYDPAKDMQG
ncbi:MAG: EVE domain-containing protein [Myxococcota bacterium]